MRFLLSIALLVGLMQPLCAQDSTSFWKHLSVEGKVGAFYFRNGGSYIAHQYNVSRDDSYPISANVHFKNGISTSLGINYSFRSNSYLKVDRNIGFFILGLNLNYSFLPYTSYIQDMNSYSHTWSSWYRYTPDEISGTTVPVELGINAKYLFRAGRVFFGVNASLNKGTYFNKAKTTLDVLYTYHAINSFAPDTYDTSRYKISVNNYFGKKNYTSATAGLILGVRLRNILLFANEEYYYNNEYRYFKMNLGLTYFF